ncbi:hypothetical protein NQ314_018930 [Rhamnusium bicolor]|uniref:Oxidative stress-induced growth inhibitor 2 n=1 Tax=Rhamnusium bicolor TaxID=1586634 RepID=A0AAV8WPT3_9CUCU|nr:hypothetical protein NQ314_018930 [Rhamnusium bicolor]
MLSGNLPYITSDSHPDEMLSARLRPVVGQFLLQQDLKHLSAGLEGRSMNRVSLLLDALLHPCADIGIEKEPLVEFRKTGIEIEHIVLGKGPPGGSWHKMDPHILTLSLGSWMALPGLPFHPRDSGEKRAFASNVAKYYLQYTEHMQLNKYFKNNVLVTSVEPINRKTKVTQEHIEKSNARRNSYLRKNDDDIMDSDEVYIEPENEENVEEYKTCFISNAINCLMLKGNRKKSRCKRPREKMFDNSPTRKIREIIKSGNDSLLNSKSSKNDKKRSVSFCCDSSNVCDSKSFNENYNINRYSLRNSCSLDFTKTVPFPYTRCDSNCNWIVNTTDIETGEKITYGCKYLVLATGGNDLPNRLEISKEKDDPDWILYDLRRLEYKLDTYMNNLAVEEVDPVLVVGAGLSAADAIIATRGRNISVIHVDQMMKDGGSTYPLYTAYPEYTLTDVNAESRTVILTSKDDLHIKLNISFAVILIGSRPDLSFFSKRL